jgi:hypothetical protein
MEDVEMKPHGRCLLSTQHLTITMAKELLFCGECWWLGYLVGPPVAVAEDRRHSGHLMVQGAEGQERAGNRGMEKG